MAETAQDQLVAYLKDAHAMEELSLKMTEAAAKAANDPEMRQLFEHHHQETEEHERLIRSRLEAHGEGTSTMKDMGARMGALTKGITSMVPDDTPGRLARDGFVQEETEIASYELLRRVAELAGDSETASVATRILQNEQQTAQKIAGMWDRAARLSLQAATT
jgi:ferritin-like metal-binding protein YciE